MMRLLEVTLPTTEENIALDETLLREAEQAAAPRETFRLWEPAAPAVILGRSSDEAAEVHAETCRRMCVPILRRPSGGATVVVGPGCLTYAVVLSRQLRPEVRTIAGAHRLVLDVMAGALAPLVPGVCRQGTSDLVIAGRKFSGNSLRCGRTHVLYHGTLLYAFPLELVGRLLAMPSRQPDYRRGRSHDDFLTNLPLDVQAIRRALAAAWKAKPQAAS